jgi:hypothetical protein
MNATRRNIMKGNRKYWRSVVAVMVVVGVLMMTGTIPVAQAVSGSDDDGDGSQARVVPLNSSAYGNTYGEWSARWVQWVLSIPEDTNPNLDTTGENCAEGQAGPVWFLAGTFGGPPVIRTCTVPAGKALFFPILVGIFGSGVFDCDPTVPVPGVLCNLAALRVAATASMDAVTLQARIDGKPLRKLNDQRVAAPEFTLTIPEGNVLGINSGTYTPQVADGYWLMLRPLSHGAHTIHFKGEITGGVFAGTVVDVTYHLTVVEDDDDD